MNSFIGDIVLLIIFSTVISRNGQGKTNNEFPESEKTQTKNKIPVPKNGFSSALVDIDGSLWFSSSGGIFHYNEKSFKNYT